MQYLFAGLDFIINQDNQPVFIEANSFPGLRFFMINNNHEFKPINDLAKALNSKPVIIYSLSHLQTFKQSPDTQLAKLAKNDCRICVLTDQEIKNPPQRLKDIFGKSVKEVDLLVSIPELRDKLEKDSKYRIINSSHLVKLTKDKWKTYRVIRCAKKLRTPISYLFRNQDNLRRILGMTKWYECVIKPRYGQKGQGVAVIEDTAYLNRYAINQGSWLVQERVNVHLDQGKYWDVRVYLVNGQFSYAVKRLSDQPVVNLSLGGQISSLENKYLPSLQTVSQDCLQILEKALN